MKLITVPTVELLAITPDAERLIERAARRCYFGKDFEAMPEESLGQYLQKIRDRGHMSVFEHAYATFDISDVSRAFLAQISRHRIASLSVESQRYRNQSGFDIVLPPDIVDSLLYPDAMEYVEQGKVLYDRLVESGIKKEDARYILHNGGTTSMMFSANFRELLHFFDLREDKHAQREIRVTAGMMRELLHAECPNIF